MHVLLYHLLLLFSLGFLLGTQLLILQIGLNLSVEVSLVVQFPGSLSLVKLLEQLIVIIVVARFNPLHGRLRLATRRFDAIFVRACILVILSLLCLLFFGDGVGLVSSRLIAKSLGSSIILFLLILIAVLGLLSGPSALLLLQLLLEFLLLELTHSGGVDVR